MENEKYSFTEEHIDIVIRMVIEGETFLRKYRSLIKPQYFGNEVKALIINEIFSYFDQYNTPPSYDIVIEKCMANKSPRVTENLIIDAIEGIVKTSIHDQKYLQDKIVEFAKHQAIKEAIIKSAGLLKTGDWSNIQKNIEEAVSVGQHLEEIGLDYFQSIDDRAQLRTVYEDPSSKILTLIPGMDRMLGNGVSRKSLAVVLAPPGFGKTTFLVNVAKGALLQNKNAVFYSLEMTDYEIADKLDSSISNIAYSEMSQKMAAVKAKLHEAASIYKGRLVIKEYAAKDCSVQVIENHLAMLEDEGFKPDMIAIDYAEIMKPLFHRSNKWDEVGDTYHYLKDLSKTKDIAIWTASQTTKGYDKETIQLTDIGLAWEKAKIADIVVSINQTEKERTNNEVRIYVNKNRKGIQDIYTKCIKNFSHMQFLGRPDII